MKKSFIFIAIFVLFFSLVSAVQVSTNKVEYSSGQTVTATITDCVGNSIVEFKNPGGSVVDIKSGEGSWSTSYNSLSDSADGKYTVEATCSNGAAQTNFCVDAPGCITVAQQTATSTPSATSSGGSSGGSSG